MSFGVAADSYAQHVPSYNIFFSTTNLVRAAKAKGTIPTNLVTTLLIKSFPYKQVTNHFVCRVPGSQKINCRLSAVTILNSLSGAVTLVFLSVLAPLEACKISKAISTQSIN